MGENGGPEFIKAKIDGDGCLLCLCGECELHQEAVDVCFRKEDQDPSEHHIIDFNGHETVIKKTHRRRSSIGIVFWCEQCRYATKLLISQHKGVTIMEWDLLSRTYIEDPS